MKLGPPGEAPEALASLYHEARRTLPTLLDDPDPTVRVAAAAAVLEALGR